jgi:thioesterase domain-containing protein
VAPLLLVHAAGSSVLQYRALVEALGEDRHEAQEGEGGTVARRTVLGVEDLSLSGARTVEFQSIGAVADSIVRRLVEKYDADADENERNGEKNDDAGGGGHLPPTMFVGGWSYGGVVALEVAARLEHMGVVVPATFLLDAPVVVAMDGGEGRDTLEEIQELFSDGEVDTQEHKADQAHEADQAHQVRAQQEQQRAERQAHVQNTRMNQAETTTNAPRPTPAGVPADLVQLGEAHFDACTALLNQHACQHRMVRGDLVNVIAANSTYGCAHESVQQCTSHGVVEGHTMEDVEHWDVVVGSSNVNIVATILSEKMEQHALAESMVRAAVPVVHVFGK